LSRLKGEIAGRDPDRLFVTSWRVMWRWRTATSRKRRIAMTAPSDPPVRGPGWCRNPVII